MTRKLVAKVDEQGRLILPPHLAVKWGLKAGDTLSIEEDGQRQIIHPPLTLLNRVYIEVTNRCNLSCATCMRNAWEVQYGCMDGVTFERILEGLLSLSPRPELFFGGYGEPLSHPGCLDMIEKARSYGLRVSLITNGIFLDEEAARRLVELQVEMLWVSIDGASPECYQDVRLGNSLPLIIENLKRLRSLQYQSAGDSPWAFRPRLGIAFVAMQRNILSLLPVIRLGRQLGAVEYSVSNVLAHDAALMAESLYLEAIDQVGSPSTRQWKPRVIFPRLDINTITAPVIVELLNSDIRLELFGGELDRAGNNCPFVARGSLAIRWDGKASPCLPLMYSHSYYLEQRLRASKEYFVGDLLVTELDQIWNDPAYTALRQRLRDFDFSPCTVCNSCEMADQNLEDCFGNLHPACGGCLWAQGLIRCP